MRKVIAGPNLYRVVYSDNTGTKLTRLVVAKNMEEVSKEILSYGEISFYQVTIIETDISMVVVSE